MVRHHSLLIISRRTITTTIRAIQQKMQELDIKQSVSVRKLSERLSTGRDCALLSLETRSQDDTTRQDSPYRGACFCCLMLSITHAFCHSCNRSLEPQRIFSFLTILYEGYLCLVLVTSRLVTLSKTQRPGLGGNTSSQAKN